MSQIPWERYFGSLGDLAVQAPAGPNEALWWIHLNVFVKLKDDSEPPGKLSLNEIAKRIDARLARHEVDKLSDSSPKAQTECSTDRLKVGAQVTVNVRFTPQREPPLVVEVFERGGGFAASFDDMQTIGKTGSLLVLQPGRGGDQSRFTCVWKASAPGRTALDVVVDSSTLLSHSERCPIVVEP